MNVKTRSKQFTSIAVQTRVLNTSLERPDVSEFLPGVRDVKGTHMRSHWTYDHQNQSIHVDWEVIKSSFYSTTVTNINKAVRKAGLWSICTTDFQGVYVFNCPFSMWEPPRDWFDPFDFCTTSLTDHSSGLNIYFVYINRDIISLISWTCALRKLLVFSQNTSQVVNVSTENSECLMLRSVSLVSVSFRPFGLESWLCLTGLS